MSTHFVTLVPRDPGFVPGPDDQDRGLTLFRRMAPAAEEITLVRHEGVEFFDAGASFEHIACPLCAATLDFGWWSETMTKDYVDVPDATAEPPGFRLRAYALPCCGKQSRLDELLYRGPQAFGRFGLRARNPDLGLLSNDQIAKLGAALGCAVTAVYTHL